MRRRNIVVAIVALLAIGGVLLISRWPEQVDRDQETVDKVAKPAPAPPPTPTEQPTTPAGPGKLTLVGRQVCKECHAENFELHAAHGHASTLALVRDLDVSEKFAGKTFDAGEPYGSYSYHTDEQGRLFATLPHKFGDEPFPLQYALGSGHNGMTFLTLMPKEGGGTAGLEHRVSLFGDGRLDISPGHEKKLPREGIEFFGNTILDAPLDKCVYCHTTSAKIINQEIVDLVANVNCEKCHGPGSEHVRLARASETPPPYSVGRDDWDTESEIQLCGDCHRLPKDISEKELREYPDLLARFQPIGLLRSKCYLESAGQLKCTTCHSPHQSVHLTSNAAQVQNCVNCHLQDSPAHVACPVSPAQGCIECHMPKLEQVNGLTFHDHWIRVREDQ